MISAIVVVATVTPSASTPFAAMSFLIRILVFAVLLGLPLRALGWLFFDARLLERRWSEPL
ncbi:MAG: hypothetical protein ABGY71_12325, partial [bacterium]